jgi:arabinofuranosyltransferase
LAVATITAFGGLYVVLVGGDWMPNFRFLVPIQPFLYLLIGVALRAIIEQRVRMLNYGLLLLLIVTGINRNKEMKGDRRKILKEDKAFWDRAAGGVVAWFDQAASKRGRDQIEGTLALGDIGQVGYQTDLPVLDLLGLVDPVIAKLPGGYTTKIGQGFRDRFFNAAPRYALIISSDHDCHHPSVIGSRVLYADRRFLVQYGVTGQIKIGDGFSWCLYENKRTLADNPDRPPNDGRKGSSPSMSPRGPARLRDRR